ncbi:MAG: RHS repeat-associated core domain-containing protein [Solirubrobacterales bacterium]
MSCFRQIVLTLIISLTTLFMSVQPVLAMSPNQLQAYFNRAAGPQAVNEVHKAQLADNMTESVDPQTGALALKKTDLYLPGRDGLDLDVTRIYNSSQAEFGSRRATLWLTSVGGQEKVSLYYCQLIGKDLDTLATIYTYTAMYTTKTDAEIAANEILYYGDGNPDHRYYDIVTIETEGFPVDVVQYVENTSVRYNYQQARYNLGTGWSLGFPSVEVQIERVQGKIVDTFYYLHTGDGTVYQVKMTDDPNDSNLLNYQGKDMVFQSDNMTYDNGQVKSKFVWISADKRKTYFAADGRLLGIVDRFGNEIRFNHIERTVTAYSPDPTSAPLISEITDSIGRKIRFTYDNTIENADFVEDKVVINVTDPLGEKTMQVTYHKGRELFHWYSPLYPELTWYEPILYSVTDTAGRVESFKYDYIQSKFRFDAFDLSTADAGRKTMPYLTEYWTNRKKAHYTYAATNRYLGCAGVYEARRVTARYDNQRRVNGAGSAYDTGDLNHLAYTYFGDNTGYPATNGAAPGPTYQFGSEVTDPDGVKTRTVFNGDYQCLCSVSTAANGEKRMSANLAFHSVFKQLPTRVESAVYASDGRKDILYTETVYNDWGGVISQTRPLSLDQLNNPSQRDLNTMEYEYHPLFRLPTVKRWYKDNATVVSETTVYDNVYGRVQKIVDPLGDSTRFSYDKDGENRVTRITTTKSLDNGKVAKTVTVMGPASYGNPKTLFAYPYEVTAYYTGPGGAPKTTKTTSTYNMLLGLVATTTNNTGKTTINSYDDAGRLLTTKLPDVTVSGGTKYSVSQHFEYTESATSPAFDSTNGDLLTVKLRSFIRYKNLATGQESDYNTVDEYYNDDGDLVLSRQMNSVTGEWVNNAQYHYDNQGRANYVVDAMGNTQTCAFDPWGQVKTSKDAFGATYGVEVDPAARTATTYMIPASGGSWRGVTRTYTDQWGQVTTRKAFANYPAESGALSESYTYDLAGNVKTYTDPKGHTDQFECDNLGNLIRVTDAMNQVTRYEYDKLGQLKTVKKTDGTATWVTSVNRDELGRVIEKTDPANHVTRNEYNELGQLVKTINPKSISFTYGYDEYNRLLSKTGGNWSVSFGYAGHPYGPSKSDVSFNGKTNQVRIGYDGMGRVDRHGTIADGYGSMTSYKYDPCNRVTGVTDSYNSFTTRFNYDKTRIQSVQANGTAAYQYTPDGQIESVTYPTLRNGSVLKASYTYDAFNRVTKVTNTKDDTVISEYRYTYDNNGNITAITDASGVTNYEYDALDRLKKVTRPDGKTVSYTYDVKGNRISAVGDQATIAESVYIKANYNPADQLTSYTTGSVTTSFDYDATGLRIKKTAGDSTTRYLYNAAGKVIAEADANNALNAHYIWGPDRMIAKQLSDGAQYYYLYNGHGDVVQIVDSNGEVVNTYQYDEWGNTTQETEKVENHFKYSGEIFDKETGLYYLRARYYNPQLGRFLNKDTYEGDITNPMSLNLYAYCGNNPLKYVDPTGHWGIDVHYFRTEEIMKEMGISEDYAEAVAQGNQSVDLRWEGMKATIGNRNRAKNGEKEIASSEDKYHFNMSSNQSGSYYDTRRVYYRARFNEAVSLWKKGQVGYNNLMAKAKKETDPRVKSALITAAMGLRESYRKQAYNTFGQGLHALQDISAHGDVKTMYEHDYTGQIDDVDYDVKKSGYESWSSTLRIQRCDNATRAAVNDFQKAIAEI